MSEPELWLIVQAIRRALLMIAAALESWLKKHAPKD